MSTASSLPGPHIDLVPEMIAWFGHHLRGDDTGVDTAPPIQVYVRDAVEPEPDLAEHPGEWWALPAWPPPEHATASFQVDGDGALLRPRGPRRRQGGVDLLCGVTAVGPAHRPAGRRGPVAPATLARARGRLDVLGHPRLHLRVRGDRPVVTLSLKLADVLPDGTSALVTRGFLNLTHRESSIEPTPVPFGEWLDLTIELEATTWHFDARPRGPPRHRPVRLAQRLARPDRSGRSRSIRPRSASTCPSPSVPTCPTPASSTRRPTATTTHPPAGDDSRSRRPAGGSNTTSSAAAAPPTTSTAPSTTAATGPTSSTPTPGRPT